MLLIEDNDMVEQLAPQRADQAFAIGILPRRMRGRDDFLDSQELSCESGGMTGS